MKLDLSLWQLVMHASLLVKGVMLLLLAASVLSWTYIFQRRHVLKETHRRLDMLVQQCRAAKASSEILAILQSGVFREGLQLYRKLCQTEGDSPDIVLRVERQLQIGLSEEMEEISDRLSFLATASAISPYVGLFGTVWGIMSSFRALGAAQQATLAMVAPGIAEALIATAMGLFVAIPASIAYNRFNHQVDSCMNLYERLAEYFLEALRQEEGAAARGVA